MRPAARYAILKTQREQPPKWLTNKLSIKPPLLAKVQGRFCYIDLLTKRKKQMQATPEGKDQRSLNP